jgi:putative FmdB family regulatory protein
MATYEYLCRECETTINISRAISDPDPGYLCETCGNRMNKVYSIGNPIFKGSGFYRTDK